MVAVPDTVFVVNTTVARPLPFVTLVGDANEPVTVVAGGTAPVSVQVTTKPAPPTGLLSASASCADMVTVAPAAGAYEVEVTRNFIGPGVVVIVAEVPITGTVSASVALTVVAVPEVLDVVNTVVATPLPLVVLVVGRKVPVTPPGSLHITV